jgi:hypothetical protein
MSGPQDEELQRATQFVLESPEARSFLWWVLAQCGVYNASSAVNGETGIREGRRLIGLTIINQINTHDPTAYAQMMIEAHKRAEKRRRENHVRPVED